MRAAAILLCFLPLLAQEQVPTKSAPDKSATASVAGVVVKADTGEPLKKARVALWSHERQANYSAPTDAEGRFEILGIKPGRYQFWASREGYVDAGYGEKLSRRRTPPIVLEGGQRLRDVIFRLQRTAVIIGRVLDEDGEPVLGAEISLSVRGPGIMSQRMNEQMVETNDMGEYRIFRVSPGKYYLSASPQRLSMRWETSGTGDEPEEQKNEKKNQPPIYAPVFYPGTTDSEQATRLDVKAGDEVRVDFTFTPVQGYRIRGRVLGVPPKASGSIAVMLASRSGIGMEMQAGRVRSDGSYEIYPVVPGSYQLAASTETDSFTPGTMQSAVKRNIEVTNSDLENVDLVAASTARVDIKGRLTVEGDSSVKLDRFVLRLVPAETEDTEFGPSSSAQVNADGTFSFQQVSPGTYSIEVNSMSYGGGRDYYVKAGRYGNRELVQSDFTVTEASSLRLELVLSSATARMEGLVVDDKDQPVAGASVVAVPTRKFKNLNYWYVDGVTDRSGRFVLPRLKPGDYRVVAFEDAEYRDSLDSNLLEKSENSSVRAQAQPGNTATIRVRIIPAAEDSQQ